MIKIRIKSNFQILLLSATLISIFMLFSSKSYGQDETGGLLTHAELLNIALENPILAPAMNTCIRQSRALGMEAVKTQEQNLKNIFSKSKIEETKANIELQRRSHPFWAMTDCYLRFYFFSVKYGLSDLTNPQIDQPTIAYYSSFYADWTDAAFSAAAVAITAKDVDTFFANGPWTWSDEDMERIANQAAAGLPIADIQKSMMNQRGKVMKQQLNNLIIGQLTQTYVSLYEGMTGPWAQLFSVWAAGGGDEAKNNMEKTQSNLEVTSSLDRLVALTQCTMGNDQILKCKAF